MGREVIGHPTMSWQVAACRGASPADSRHHRLLAERLQWSISKLPLSILLACIDISYVLGPILGGFVVVLF